MPITDAELTLMEAVAEATGSQDTLRLINEVRELQRQLARKPRSKKQKIEDALRESDLGAQMAGRTDIEYGHHETLPRGEHVAARKVLVSVEREAMTPTDVYASEIQAANARIVRSASGEPIDVLSARRVFESRLARYNDPSNDEWDFDEAMQTAGLWERLAWMMYLELIAAEKERTR